MSEAYIGEIRLFGGGFAPRGWLLCDGRLVRRESYAELFDVIGHRYGGDESTFAVPNLNDAANGKNGVAYIIAATGRMPVQPILQVEL